MCWNLSKTTLILGMYFIFVWLIIISSFLFSLFLTIVQVDLEHNHYRSFQGLTCLMQATTRTEDFVVDTLKLGIHIGPHLKEVFKDPMKKKVDLFHMIHLWDCGRVASLWWYFHLSGHAWSGSWYNVAPKGLWHICLQYVRHWVGFYLKLLTFLECELHVSFNFVFIILQKRGYVNLFVVYLLVCSGN